jgi:hypothetical protein
MAQNWHKAAQKLSLDSGLQIVKISVLRLSHAVGRWLSPKGRSTAVESTEKSESK